MIHEPPPRKIRFDLIRNLFATSYYLIMAATLVVMCWFVVCDAGATSAGVTIVVLLWLATHLILCVAALLDSIVMWRGWLREKRALRAAALPRAQVV